MGRLAMHAPLSPDDRAALLELPHASRFYETGSFLVREGDAAGVCSVLVSGLGYRHKVSGEGQRQIVSMHVPGEMFDLQQLYLEHSDCSLQTSMRSEVATMPRTALRRLAHDRPAVADALVAMVLVELATAREWLLNIGRRDSYMRIAHFLCELAVRLKSGGLPPGQGYELPMTQEQLGDAVGLTAVHISRTLKRLVRDGLVAYGKSGVSIPDWEKLVRAADFNSRYLHLDTHPATLPAQ